MPAPWFAVEQEKPDIGTVVFKADDYYERLQHITGLWNDTNFLFSEMIDNKVNESSSEDEGKKTIDPKRLFTVDDITSIPLLMGFLDRANMKGKIPSATVEFLWEVHKLNVRKLTELGFAVKYMSSREFYLIDNREKWKRLMSGMQELKQANQVAKLKVRRKKRMLKPATLNVIKRIEDIPGVKLSKRGSLTLLNEKETLAQEREKIKSKLQQGGKQKKNLMHNEKYMKKLLRKGVPEESAAFATFAKGNRPPEPTDWDFGRSRAFFRRNQKPVSTHYELSRWYHKVSRALRFSKNEPIDWRTITLDELEQHCYQNDCWMAIKGRVYDVTEYLKDHPGGGNLVMQAAGCDATELFVAVHPYVVFYKDLARKQIGRLPNYEEHRRTEWEPSLTRTVCGVWGEWIRRRKNPYRKLRPTTSFSQTDTEFVYTVEFPEHGTSTVDDWTVAIVGGFQVTVIKHIDTPYVWYGGFDLSTKVLDDTVYREFSNEFTCLRLTIAKPYKVKVKKPIKDFRMDHGFFLSSYTIRSKFKVSIVQRTSIVRGIKLYGISLGMNKFLGCPIGSYVYLQILDEARPYTPVCLLDEFESKYKDESGNFQTLFFIIKEFKDGDFTAMLHHMPLKIILMGVNLYMSAAMGNFKVGFLHDEMDSMMLFAGGTGISVMTRIIQEYIANSKKSVMTQKPVILVQCTQFREEIIWQEKWEELSEKYQWFYYFYSLTRTLRYKVQPKKIIAKVFIVAEDPDETSKKQESEPLLMEFDDEEGIHEMYGYPSLVKMERIFSLVPDLGKPNLKHKAIICGPYGFNQSISRLLKEFGKHEIQNTHYFAG